MKLFEMRKEYRAPEISLEDMNPDPFTQFEGWFTEASERYGDHTNAMSLATASAGAAPSIRTVLLKSFDRDGFVFFTNYGSRKAKEINENPQVALMFPWIEMHRQVIITGTASKNINCGIVNLFYIPAAGKSARRLDISTKQCDLIP